jgi:hypothetical protein
MSPRRVRRDPHKPLPDLVEQVESWLDGDWMVRPVSGAAATKAYRCPGCDQEIPAGTPHVVAWPAEQPFGINAGVGDRRHWHRPCWRRRLERRPARRAGRRPGRAGR